MFPFPVDTLSTFEFHSMKLTNIHMCHTGIAVACHWSTYRLWFPWPSGASILLFYLLTVHSAGMKELGLYLPSPPVISSGMPLI